MNLHLEALIPIDTNASTTIDKRRAGYHPEQMTLSSRSEANG